MIQKQTWNDEIRILITDEENLGSVQVLIPLYVSDIFGKAGVFWDSWDGLLNVTKTGMNSSGEPFAFLIIHQINVS